MNSNEHSPTQKKISINNENYNNYDTSGIQIIEESNTNNSNEKTVHHKEKGKKQIKKNILKKINNEIEIVQEQKIVKIKELINDEYINSYDPIMQDNTVFPKLSFFVDNESVSESDKDLSSASLSSEEMENNNEAKK